MNTEESRRLGNLGCSGAEGGDSLLLAFVDLKYGCQLGGLEDVSHTVAKAGEPDIGAIGAGGGVNANQGAQSAAIHIGHFGKIDDDAGIRNQDLFKRVPQSVGFVSEHDAPSGADNRDTIELMLLDLKIHSILRT